MKDIQSLINKNMQKLDESRQNPEKQADDFNDFYPKIEIDAKSAKVINYIFSRLNGIVPAFKYSVDSKASEDAIRREYTYAILDAKINDIDCINRGLKKLKDQNPIYLPSPKSFVDLCKPTHAELGYPSVEDAYKQACYNAHPAETDKKWAHDVVCYAFVKTGSFDLRTESKTKTFPIFEKHYSEACQLHAAGGSLKQLESNKTKDRYQEYYGAMKMRIDYGYLPANTEIMSFEDWSQSNG